MNCVNSFKLYNDFLFFLSHRVFCKLIGFLNKMDSMPANEHIRGLKYLPIN